MASVEQQQKLQALSDEYQDLQAGWWTSQWHLYGANQMTELENIVAARQKLDSQFQENKAVQKVDDYQSTELELQLTSGRNSRT